MVTTAMIFGNGMVLQREKPIPVWGTADPGSEITVTFDQETVTAQTDKTGGWNVLLSPHPAAEGLTLTVRCGASVLEYTDLCVGEVWIAGGQSNMEFYLGHEMHYEEVISSYENDNVRFFDYPEAAYEGALLDWNYVNEGFWRKATKEDMAYFSAVGFYFARDLQKYLGVPVGVIGCNWGGSPACAWMDPEYLKGTAGEVWIKDYEQDIKNRDMVQFLEDFKKNPLNDRTNMLKDPVNTQILKTGLSREEQKEMMNNFPGGEFPPFCYERRPGGIYETMLKKIVPYAVRGVIWYQGETDGDIHPEAYTEVFSAMIQNWRDLWKEQLPFLFVQLAPFGEWMACYGKTYGIVRKCQDAVSAQVPDTWMATTGDVGMEWDIHPKNKQPVGERLALLARGHVYGEEVVCDPPEAERAYRDGDQIKVVFRNAQGLTIDGESLQAVQAVYADGSTRDLTKAWLQQNVLVLPETEDAVQITLGATDYYEVNLYNTSHIPAKPFQLTVDKMGLPEPDKTQHHN